MNRKTENPRAELVARCFSRASSLWLIFLIALALRLLYIASLKEGFYFSDFRAYDQAARFLVENRAFDPEYARPPLYPVFLALNYLLFGYHLYPVRIVQAILGALGALLVFAVARRILGQRAAVIAAWIAVFYPYYIFIAGLLYPTLLTAFLLSAVVMFLLQAVEQNSLMYLGLSSLALGMASLAVPVSLAFLPFLLLWLLLFSGFPRARKLLFATLSLAVIVLTLLPWTYRCYQRYGQIVLVDARAAKHLPRVSGQSGDALQKEGLAKALAATFRADPARFLGSVGREFIHFWTFVPDRVVTKNVAYRQNVKRLDERMVVQHSLTSNAVDLVSILSYGPVFLLALAGIILCAPFWRLLILPVTLLLSHAIGYSFFFTQVRYRLPVEFCLMILAGGGADYLLARFRREKQHKNR